MIASTHSFSCKSWNRNAWRGKIDLSFQKSAQKGRHSAGTGHPPFEYGCKWKRWCRRWPCRTVEVVTASNTASTGIGFSANLACSMNTSSHESKNWAELQNRHHRRARISWRTTKPTQSRHDGIRAEKIPFVIQYGWATGWLAIRNLYTPMNHHILTWSILPRKTIKNVSKNSRYLST